MLGGRPLQNLEAELSGDAQVRGRSAGWIFARRARPMSPSNGGGARPDPAGGFAGALEVDSSDPDTLVAWLQGRSEIAYRSQKPLRLRGDVSVTADRIAIEGLKAEIDGGAVEGRLAVAHQPGAGGSRLRGGPEGRSSRSRCRSRVCKVAGGTARRTGRTRRSCRSRSAARSRPARSCAPFTAKFGYDPKTLILDQLKFGDANGVTTEGAGSFDRANATGKLALNSSAASLTQITALDPAACAVAGVADRCDGCRSGAGPPQADARCRQECRTRRSRQCARRRRSRCAAAQGHRHHHRKARSGGDARDRSRRAPPQRNRRRIQTVVGAGQRACWRCWGSIARSPRAKARLSSRDR